MDKTIWTLPSSICCQKATIYSESTIEAHALVIYFHGGGLLYGRRDDLPDEHIQAMVNEGIILAACDYPLAPAVKIDIILEEVCKNICELHRHFCFGKELPYFLWGRSAGAYLCLLAAIGKTIPVPEGIISYYGYGLLTDGWFDQPSGFYQTLPAVDEGILSNHSMIPIADGDMETRYGIYVYARQNGEWLKLIYAGREKLFYLQYTLRACEEFLCPLFCAHSTQDPDVPYKEFMELSDRFGAKKFIVSGKEHDFDRYGDSEVTKQLLEETLKFIKSVLGQINKIDIAKR